MLVLLEASVLAQTVTIGVMGLGMWFCRLRSKRPMLLLR